MNILYILIISLSFQNPFTGETLNTYEQTAHIVNYSFEAQKLVHNCNTKFLDDPYLKCESQLYRVNFEEETVKPEHLMRIY